MDVGDPRLLAIRVFGGRLERAARDDPGLERGVPLDQPRIGEQRIAEREVAGQLLAVGEDVAVDAERGAGSDQRTNQHGPAGWPRIRAGLRAEAEVAQHRGHRRDVVRRRRDGQVDDALAGQTWDRGAADVFDREVSAALVDQLRDGGCHLDRPGVPRFDCRGQSDVGSDRRVHRASVDCAPMRQVIGRRVLEVDVG